jgi:hypothetical protein
MLMRRLDHITTKSYAELYEWLEPGQLLAEPVQGWDHDWRAASADTFDRR